MILPWLTGFKYLKQVTLVWILLGLNIFIFMLTTVPETQKTIALEKQMGSNGFVKVQVFHYLNYLKKNKTELPEDLEDLQNKFDAGEIDYRNYENILMQVSFKDNGFIKSITEQPSSIEPYGDQVLDQKWLKSFRDFLANHQDDLQSLYGLSSFGHKWSHYFTYQFIHSGYSHLISNMIVLFTFGVAVEASYGAITLGFLYLIGGLAGALFFVFVGGLSIAPLIGASASVSALLGFYLMVEEKRHVSFFYFLTPIEGYYGEIYLSKFWLIPMALLNDITGVLSTPGWMTSVAYTAHLGATVFGLLVGLAYSYSLKFYSKC